MKQITDGVYQIGFFGSFLNVYIVERGDDLALIDTGIGAQTINGVKAVLEKNGRRLEQIKHVLITHAHPDHVGGLGDLQGRIHARIIMHPADAGIVRGEHPSLMANAADLKGFARVMGAMIKPYTPKTPTQVDLEVRDGDRLDDVLAGLRVVELPGHSHGQIGFYWPARKLLFGGDVMMHLPWGLTLPLRAVSPDWQAVKESIRKVSRMDVEILCLGHGDVLQTGAGAKVSALAAKL